MERDLQVLDDDNSQFLSFSFDQAASLIN